jgi:TonB family protein
MLSPNFPAEAATSVGGHIVPVPSPESPYLPAGFTAPKSIGVHGCGGYPAAAARDRAGGATEVNFRITAEGKVASPDVSKSSGSEALDRASLLCVASWLYKPATRDSAPIEVQWRASVNWNTPSFGDNPSPDEDSQISVPVWAHGGFRCEQWYAAGSQKSPRHVILTFSVEPDGSVKDVTLSQTSGSEKIDADAVECLKQRRYQPAKQHGEPIEYRLTESLY